MPRPGSHIVHPDLLDQLQSIDEDAMPDVGQIQRPGRTTDAGGGSTTAYTNVGDAVVMRVVPLARMRPSERQIASTITGETLAVLVFPAGTDVGLQDRVVVNGARTFEIVDDATAGQSYGVEVRMLAAQRGT